MKREFKGNNYILVIDPDFVREGRDGDLRCDRYAGEVLPLSKGLKFSVPAGRVAYPGGLQYSTFHGVYGCSDPLPEGEYIVSEYMSGDAYAPATGVIEEENKMTAREFLNFAGLDVNEKNLYLLTRYLESEVDYSQFPDAEATSADGSPLSESFLEPGAFQDYIAE